MIEVIMAFIFMCGPSRMSLQKRWKELSREDHEPTSDSPPPAQASKTPSDKHNGCQLSCSEERADGEAGKRTGTGTDAPSKEQESDGAMGK